MKIMNMKSLRTNKPVANQFVFVDTDKIVFQSYDSVCCILEKTAKGIGRITLGRDYNYSVTTCKYLFAFLREYANMKNVNRKSLEIAIKNKDIIFDENLV